ncbi:MAG: DUF4199 domain-containing protein [Saprospiraceae bacterium]|nr:DUF4199 domain-containing protein [Saprospiraceae bacterium]
MNTLDNPVFEQKPVSKWPVALRWGIIGGLASAAVSMIWHVAGLTSYEGGFSGGNMLGMVVGWGITLGAISMGIKQYRDDMQGGYITFGSAFGTGVLVALVMAVITGIFTAVFMSVIAPEIMDTVMEQTREKLEGQGMDDDQIEEALKYSAMFTGPVAMSVFAFFGGMFSGVIFSLIGAAIMKKDTPTSI